MAGNVWVAHKMNVITQRNALLEARVHECISLAKDITLASHDTAADTQRFVYTRNPDDLEQKWQKEDAATQGIRDLRARLALLPGSVELRRQCDAIDRQNHAVCGSLEARAIKLTQAGRTAQARALIESQGKAERDDLELQLDDLIGVNPDQDPSAAPRGLAACRTQARQDAASAAAAALTLGWAVQGVILLLSLGIAVTVICVASAGVRAALRARNQLYASEVKYRLLFEKNPHPMWVYERRSLRFLAVNQAAVSHYGYTRDEFLAMTLLDIRLPEDHDAVRDAAQSPVYGSFWQHRKKDGTPLWAQVTSHPLIWEMREAAMVIAQDITVQREAEALIRWQAYNDPLTGLPNRARFGEAWTTPSPRARAVLRPVHGPGPVQARQRQPRPRRRRPAAPGGRRPLQRAAEIGGPHDLLARMGGDEFTLLVRCPQADARPAGREAAAAAETLLDALAAPILLDGHELHVAASVGLSRFPEDGTDAETLLKHADLAMYHAKGEGRGRWQAFTPAMTEAARERLELENGLRKAIEREELDRCSTSRRCLCRGPARSSASRPWSAGTTPSWAWSRRAASSRWPRRPA